MHPFSPEGTYAKPPAYEALRKGIGTDNIFQAMCVKCDEQHNLHVDLGTIGGIIPREEAALGIADGKVNEYAILSTVGKPVSFQILRFDERGNGILSRRKAQQDAQRYFLSSLCPGDVIPAVVQNPTEFGVFCDIGCGLPALMRIDRCCISRLQSTAQRYTPRQNIFVVIYQIDDESGRIELTGRELLGTWSDNAQLFRPGQTVTGIVRSIMDYGIFIELTPNLSGLAEPQEGLSVGDTVSVYIRSIQSKKHKIKLTVVENLKKANVPTKLNYFISGGHLDVWEYYPGSNAITVF